MSKLYDLAIRFYNNREFEKAGILAKNIIYSEPLDAKNYKLYGAVNQSRGLFSYAIGAYQHAFKLNCQDAATAFQIAQCYVQLDRSQSALRWAKIAQELAPDERRYQKLVAAVEQKIS